MDKLKSALGMKGETREGDAFNRDLQVCASKGGRKAGHVTAKHTWDCSRGEGAI